MNQFVLCSLYYILYYISTVEKETRKALNLGTKLSKVLPGAWLGQKASFRLPAPVKSPEDARARSQGGDTKGKVAAPSPQLAPSSPSGREDLDRTLPSFPTGLAEQMPLRPSPLRSSCRPGRGKFVRGSPGLQRKVPGGGGTTLPGRTPVERATRGPRRPRAQRKRARGWLTTLETPDHFRVEVTLTALPFLAAFSLPNPPGSTRCFTSGAFFCFFFKRVVCAGPRRGRAGRGAQPFPPRPGAALPAGAG